MKGWTPARIASGIRRHALEGILDALVAGAAQVLANIAFDVYWRDWAVAALEDLVALVKASTLVAVGLFALNLISVEHSIPNSAILPGLGLVLLAEGALKLRPRWRQIIGAAFGAAGGREGAIIVGAGRTGQLLARDLSDGSRGTRVVCFVDDDPARQGTYVRGVRVEGTVADLDTLIERFKPVVVIVAVRDAPAELVRRVLMRCRESAVRVRAVRGFQLASADRSPLRQLDI